MFFFLRQEHGFNPSGTSPHWTVAYPSKLGPELPQSISTTVVYHPNTGHLAGIGMVLALAGWYIQLVFLYCRIWRELYFEVSGDIKIKKNHGKPFLPQKGAECSKRGRKPAFLEGKRGSHQFFDTKMYQPSFPSVSVCKIPRKYQPIPTKNTKPVNNSNLHFCTRLAAQAPKHCQGRREYL